jgi:polar amino acid transport system substrate-binding protein
MAKWVLLLLLFPLVAIGAGSPSAPTIQPGELRWAADAESGAPYAYRDPTNPGEIIGFERDLMEEIAAFLGKKLIFVQNNWDGLPQGLDRGDYDVAANGLEITPERSQEVLFSDPYYTTFEQLVVRADDMETHSLADLKDKSVGTLRACQAQRILETEYPQTKLKIYDDEAAGYQDVEIGRIHAFFVDFPIALYYAFPNPKLKAVGPPVGSIQYGIAFKKDRLQLRDAVNDALSVLRQNGKLDQILSNWKLNLKPDTNASSIEASGIPSQARAKSLTERLKRYWMLTPLLLKGAAQTLVLSVLAMALAMALGLGLVLLRMYGPTWAQKLAIGWIEIVRGTPLLIQLYLIFYGLPSLGIRLNPFMAAIVGLGMNYASCEAENYRAGILSVADSQLEAAQALAMSPYQRFRYVLMPQALRVILPPITNDFIALLKDSSLVSVITMVELTTIYSQLASTYYDHLGLGIYVALLYFALGYPFVRLLRRLEARSEKSNLSFRTISGDDHRRRGRGRGLLLRPLRREQRSLRHQK